MTKREALRQARQLQVLQSLGFTQSECAALRRISMTLQRWHELECGTGEGQVTRSVERENADGTGKPYMRVQYPTSTGYVDRRYPIADRETGAKNRLYRIIDAANKARLTHMTGDKMTPQDALTPFIQTDPRGAALYILRPGDVPAGADVSAYYSRGVCVY